MVFAAMAHEKDPADEIYAELGDFSGVELFHNQVLVAVYQRPEKTKSGLILSHKTLDEDRYQSKIGLVIKAGPQAFKSNGEWEFPEGLDVGSWVLFRPSDGWSMQIGSKLCRVLSDTSIRGRVTHPDLVW